MKKYNPSDIRNFAIVGHGTTGKTTLAEAMLVCGKEINRMVILFLTLVQEKKIDKYPSMQYLFIWNGKGQNSI
jgi:translation elongation factor EF-4